MSGAHLQSKRPHLSLGKGQVSLKRVSQLVQFSLFILWEDCWCQLVSLGSRPEAAMMFGRFIAEVLMGSIPAEKKEGGLDGGRNWTTLWSSWKPRPTLEGILKMRWCLRLDPSSDKRAGLFYPPTDQLLSVGSPSQGHVIEWCSQLRQSLRRADSWRLSVRTFPAAGKWVLPSRRGTAMAGTSVFTIILFLLIMKS